MQVAHLKSGQALLFFSSPPCNVFKRRHAHGSMLWALLLPKPMISSKICAQTPILTHPCLQAMPGEPGAEQTKHYEAELEINDFPQHSRWKVGCY
eukprot:262354-Pelagomonas_calceolata.AAC.3